MTTPKRASARATEAASDARTPEPPPYPFPGWSADNVPPDGYRWEWRVEDSRWSLGGEGKACRFTIGPGHTSCKRPAVAILDRGSWSKRKNRWAYCEQHLYSRHIHDGAIWTAYTVPTDAQGASDV